MSEGARAPWLSQAQAFLSREGSTLESALYGTLSLTLGYPLACTLYLDSALSDRVRSGERGRCEKGCLGVAVSRVSTYTGRAERAARTGVMRENGIGKAIFEKKTRPAGTDLRYTCVCTVLAAYRTYGLTYCTVYEYVHAAPPLAVSDSDTPCSASGVRAPVSFTLHIAECAGRGTAKKM